MSPITNLITPLKDVKIHKHQIPAHNLIPNTSIKHKPLLIYTSAFNAAKNTTASNIESHLSATGVVDPQWRYTMYSTSHFHSTSHEVLCVFSGSARLCFGHEENPGRVEVVVGKGDVVVVPAGVAHRLVEDLSGGQSDGFEMVGAYPKGCSWDMCYGKKGEEGKVGRIGGLEWFERDPVFGDGGPACEV
ncbi:hypothetical protein AAFC00_002220 [Neodothiora populina]|uniref:Cupin type-2 domain-containing protein n=1 Tax=Neodothiora populina TaxID=2781224 RepID=A0ABR3PH32_9PEZI